MNNIWKAVGLAIVAATMPLAANAQTLWQNVSVGMNAHQVAEAQPSAIYDPKPSRLGNGATCDLKIPSLDIDSAPYRVCFFFKDAKLAQVTLNALGEPSDSQFRSVVTLLRAKYGKELSNEANALGFEANWLTPEGVNISVIFFNSYGKLLNINYQVRIASESGKL